MVNINLNIQKKDLWLLSAIIVFLVGVGFVIAYTTDSSGTPSIMGHSFDETELPSCTTGQVLKTNSAGDWECQNDNGCTSTVNLYSCSRTTRTEEICAISSYTSWVSTADTTTVYCPYSCGNTCTSCSLVTQVCTG